MKITTTTAAATLEMGTINLLNTGVIKSIMSRNLWISETITEYWHETSITSEDNTTKIIIFAWNTLR